MKHREELAAVQAHLFETFSHQLAAVESNRDALLGEVAEQREATAAVSARQLAELQAEHRKQTVTYRRLLAEEQQRCAAARSDVLRLSIEAGNERLVMKAKVRKYRERATTASAQAEAVSSQIEIDAVSQAAGLAARLRIAERAAAEADQARSARDEEHRLQLQQMRAEQSALHESLREAHSRVLRAEACSKSLRAAATDLRQKLKTAEADVARLREQLARAPQGTRPLSARVVKGQGRDTRRN
uniref:Uncharacterized protein n=1 Tax=Haptolina ericina TaxID=156174 RepID=A0A7S3B7L3_9EUKA|mmetsp:Transcript_53231/g.119488  ORF Transcript_53231/g.119488 Transcript_53231/m.119488 type:complete len:244 (+) Transcript_53231:1-732(+)